MEFSYEKHADEAVVAQVSSDRVTINQTKKKHHKHKTFGLVSIHGFLLTVSFMSLSGGILAIRSGIGNSFKMHWVVQSVAGGAIVLGCLMGVWLSISVSLEFLNHSFRDLSRGTNRAGLTSLCSTVGTSAPSIRSSAWLSFPV